LADAPAVKKFANIHLTVTEAPKPVVKPPAEVTPPQPTLPEPQKCSTDGYLNRREGTLVWNGNLPPNGKVVIEPNGVVGKDSGEAVGNAIPRLACFDVSNLPPGIHAATSASMLILTNTSGAPVKNITVHWVVR